MKFGGKISNLVAIIGMAAVTSFSNVGKADMIKYSSTSHLGNNVPVERDCSIKPSFSINQYNSMEDIEPIKNGFLDKYNNRIRLNFGEINYIQGIDGNQMPGTYEIAGKSRTRNRGSIFSGKIRIGIKKRYNSRGKNGNIVKKTHSYGWGVFRPLVPEKK